MNNQEFYSLFKNSRLAQVASPLSKKLRGPKSAIPTHQVIYTPVSSARRSNFGIKTALPKQIGKSHIIYNDIDNYKGMPDVEKYSGSHYTRLKFQESGIVLRKPLSAKSPLFNWDSAKSESAFKESASENVMSKLGLSQSATVQEVRDLLRKNPLLHRDFKTWLLNKNPELIVFKVPSKLDQLLKEFIDNSDAISKRKHSLAQLSRKAGVASAGSPKSHIQGTAGLSYLQNGRLTNTPNGVKHGVVMPGRLVREREAAVGGFVAGVNERTITLQANYIKNSPGKHSRQFVMPFKINEAELMPSGSVRLSADGVKVGSWMLASESENRTLNYTASNPDFGSMSERNQRDFSALESLLGLVSKPAN